MTFAQATNEGAKTFGRTFNLLNDIVNIDMQPICSKDSFKGTFNGNNHTVTNVNINTADSTENYGFFGKLDKDADIHNLTINTININNRFCQLCRRTYWI